MPVEHAQLGVGQQVERLLGDRERVHAVLVGPQQQRRHLDQPVGVEQVGLRARRPAPGGPRPRARAVGVAAEAAERVADQVARGRVAARRQPLADAGPEREPRRVRDQRGRGPGTAAARTPSADRALEPLALGPPVHRVRHQHEPAGRELAA